MSLIASLFIAVAFVIVAILAANLIANARALLSSWRRRLVWAGALVPVLVVIAWWYDVPVPGWLLLISVAAIAYLVWLRWLRNGSIVSRWGESARRKSGVAGFRDIWRAASWRFVRGKARVLRPQLTHGMTRRELWRVPIVEFAMVVARAGLLRLFHPVEDVGLLFGGPRTGKTQWLGGAVLDSPGACLVTSTRTDLYDLTAPIRSSHGPVSVFNPAGVGDRPSTITFDPLTGCADPVTAVERAVDLLAGVGGDDGGDRKFWNDQAKRILACLMHAAALDGTFTMADVARWVANPTAAEAQIVFALKRSPMPGNAVEIAQFIGTNERTRTSITSTIALALGWLTSPSARDAATAGLSLDVEDLLATRGTIYMFGAKDSNSAPLVAAFTGYIAREARRIAARQPGGRLDPPLRLCLDEAALLAPPLEDWTADMGGRGVTIFASFQSRAQLLSRWSEAQAAEILNNAALILLFGGTNDKDDLQFWSLRAGDRDEPQINYDKNGGVTSRTTRKAPVLAPAQLAQLPEGRVVIFRRGMPPVVAKAAMAYKRRDVREAHGTTAALSLSTLLALWQRLRPEPTPPTWGGVLKPADQPDSAPQPVPERTAA